MRLVRLLERFSSYLIASVLFSLAVVVIDLYQNPINEDIYYSIPIYAIAISIGGLLKLQKNLANAYSMTAVSKILRFLVWFAIPHILMFHTLSAAALLGVTNTLTIESYYSGFIMTELIILIIGLLFILWIAIDIVNRELSKSKEEIRAAVKHIAQHFQKGADL